MTLRNQIDILPAAEVSAMNPKESDAAALCNADKPMKYGLAIAGLMSGDSLFARTLSLKILSSCHHAFVCILVVANIFVSLSIAWHAEEDADTFYLFMKLTTFAWYLQLAGCVCVTFFNCHRKSCLNAYYTQLSKVEQQFSSLQVPIRKRRIRNASIIATTIGWALAIVNISLNILDYATVREQSIIYGNSLEKRVNSETTILALQMFGLGTNLLITSHWILIVVYYFVIGFSVLTVTEDFNRKLAKEVSISPGSVLHNISRYRASHLELCNLISKANGCLSPIIGIHVAGNVLMLLLILYLLSIAISDPESTLFVAFANWLLTGCGILLTYIAVANKVSSQVGL